MQFGALQLTFEVGEHLAFSLQHRGQRLLVRVDLRFIEGHQHALAVEVVVLVRLRNQRDAVLALLALEQHFTRAHGEVALLHLEQRRANFQAQFRQDQRQQVA